MKDQTWDLNKTCPVLRKWYRFTNAREKKLSRPSSNLGRKNMKSLITILRLLHSTPNRISPERNLASTNKNASVNPQCDP